MGCIHCGYDNTCAYQDGLKQFIQEKLIPAEAIIFAGAIRDRYLSSRWKRYFDRSFVFGHTSFLRANSSGSSSPARCASCPTCGSCSRRYVQAQECNLAGFATDEDDTPEAVTAGLQALADKIDWALEHDLKAPPNYLSFGLPAVQGVCPQEQRDLPGRPHLLQETRHVQRPPQRLKAPDEEA